MLEHLRALVCEMNLMLPKAGLVTWTSGNVSGRDPDSGLVACVLLWTRPLTFTSIVTGPT